MSQGRLRGHFKGVVYRAHNPRWAYTPTSGNGASLHGGRFNRSGTLALYMSLDVKTAWMEAQQGFPFKPQPMTLVAYQVDCQPIVDLSTGSLIEEFGISADILANPWEAIRASGHTPPSWKLVDDLIARGVCGILVPSYAPGCTDNEVNLVLWSWSDTPPCGVVVIDDQGRLPRNDHSWS